MKMIKVVKISCYIGFGIAIILLCLLIGGIAVSVADASLDKQLSVENPAESLTNNEYFQVLESQKIALPSKMVQNTYIMRIKDKRCESGEEKVFIFNYRWCTQIR